MRPLFLALLALAPLAASAADYPDPLGKPTARTFPYSMIGQVLYKSGGSFLSTGTVINPTSVLTAGHALYDPDTGWSTEVLFRRSTHGTTFLDQQYARRIYVLAGYQTEADSSGAEASAAFTKDLGGMVFRRPAGGGANASWIADPTLLTGTAYNIALGYGGETHSGDKLLFVEPDVSFYRSYLAFFENDSIGIEPGMSGGPVFAERNGQLQVAAIIVSGSQDPDSGGVRVLNGKAAQFIQTYLP